MGRPSDARERLIRAAKAVIFAQSYQAVTVDELCAAASVTKSSFYHFFNSKQDLLLVALESQWQWFEANLLIPAFHNDLPPVRRILRFFELTFEGQRAQKVTGGYMRGCPLGNLTLEMSTQDELIRRRVEELFREWLGYFERTLKEAQEQDLVAATLDPALVAQALLAYFEGVILLAKGRNDPALIVTLKSGVLALIQSQEQWQLQA